MSRKGNNRGGPPVSQRGPAPTLPASAAMEMIGLLNDGQWELLDAKAKDAIKKYPTNYFGWKILGALLYRARRTAEAIEPMSRAAKLCPQDPEVHSNLGAALNDIGKLSEAEASCRKALDLNPDYAEALNNLGNVLKDLGRLGEAESCYRRALAIKPDYTEAHSNLLYCQSLNPAISDEALFRSHLDWGARQGTAQHERSKSAETPRDPNRPLHVGFISGNFAVHPVGWFLDAVWAAHDRDAIIIHAYSDRDIEDPITQRLRKSASHWRKIIGLSDQALADLIRADGIDILVDLDGHTKGNRLLTFAQRPAPVQVSWLGYWHSTGLSAIDATLMDAVSVPAGHDRWFVEPVIRLPESRFCYAPPEYAPPVAPPPSTTGKPVTFGSFNNTAKLNETVLALWGRVLEAVPGSNLVIKWNSLSDEGHRSRFKSAFRAAGGDETRLDLRGYSPHPQMLAEYRDIDIALDPFPFCGALTSCEALWMGVPVITLPGSRPVSRQTLVFLTTIGLEQSLAATSPDDYVSHAVRLSTHPDELTALRGSLRQRLRQSPLCDGPRFARNLERTFRELWTGFCSRDDTPA